MTIVATMLETVFAIRKTRLSTAPPRRFLRRVLLRNMGGWLELLPNNQCLFGKGIVDNLGK